MADIKKLAEELVNLTVKEVNELATILKDEYGIEPAAAAVAVAAPAAGAEAVAEHEVQEAEYKHGNPFFSFRQGRSFDEEESNI